MDGTKQPPPAPSIPNAAYAGVVAGLALFLILLFTLPDPIRSYIARAVVVQQVVDSAAPASTPLPLQREQALRIADEIIRQQTAGETSLTATEHCVALKLPFIQAHCEPLSPGAVQMELACQARHALQALELCQVVADKILQAQPQRWTPNAELQRSQREDLQRRLTLAKETERSIADELLQLENERLHQALHTVQKLPATQSTATVVPPIRSPLEEKYAQLLEQRQVLLRAKTEAHPLVQEFDANLAEFKKQMQQEVMSEVKSTNIATPIAQVQTALQGSEHKRSELMEQRNDLRGRIESLEADLKRLEQPLPDVALQTKISQPTTIIERQGGQPGWLKLTLFSLLSCGLGCLTYYLVSQVSRQRVFHSWLQVRDELQLEVLGAPSTLEKVSPRGTRVEFCLRNSILLAELVVFVLSITLTYALATQAQLTQPPLHDPWGAVAEALDRVGEGNLRR